MLEILGVISTTIMPLFNIPLILNIRKRKCSCDISLVWASGIWFCSLLLIPASFISGSVKFQIIAIVNFIIFTVATLYIVRYHHAGALERIMEYVGRQLYNLGQKSIVDTDGRRSYLYFND